LSYELEFENMGRNAATILSSNFEYNFKDLLKKILLKIQRKSWKNCIGTVVTRIDKQDNTFIEIGEVKGILQRKSRIKGETFKVGDTC
jgi:N utilization substance protein A